MKSEIFQALGLKLNPFPPGACKELYFHTEVTKRSLQELAYGVRSRKGFLLLTGEVGYGKTSLLLQLMPRLEKDEVETSWVFNTFLDTEGMMRAVIRDFGLKAPDKADVSGLVDILFRFFIDRAEAGKNCVIAVDEAHHLSLDTLESLRMLSNLELDGEKLVQILLVGQPELLAKLQKPELRQLRSRINVFLNLPGLTLEETGSYVNFKLSAGGSDLRIGGEALTLLWDSSGGCLRIINLIMEKALYATVALDDNRLSPKVLRAAIEDVAASHDDVGLRLRKSRRRRLANRAVVLAALLLLALGVGFLAMRHSDFRLPTSLDDLRQAMRTREAPPAPEAAEGVRAEIADQGGDLDGPGAAIAGETREAAPEQAADKSEARPVAQPAAESATQPEAAKAETAAPSRPAAVDPAARALSEAVRAFLEPLGLMNLGSDLRQALQTRNLEHFEQRLPKNVELVSLEYLPPGRDTLYEAFPWRRLTDSSPEWLALWKPSVRIVSVHPDDGGEEVAKLQRRLKAMGYYTPVVDGVYGPKTWEAVRDFQTNQGLRVTGQPDGPTRLWIVALSEGRGEF